MGKTSVSECQVEKCDKPYKGLGYCDKHHQRFKKYGDPTKVGSKYAPPGPCTVDGCQKKYYANGYCGMHYQRAAKYGDPLTVSVDRDGRTKHPLWQTYQNMKQRCYNKDNDNYQRWGGRGIIVCDRWLGSDGFQNFIEDMGRRPKGMSLDRKNNDGNYEESNCRWATATMQASNRHTPITNKSGTRGVCYDQRNNRYKAYIVVSKQRIHLGYYKTLEEAVKMRKKAELSYY